VIGAIGLELDEGRVIGVRVSAQGAIEARTAIVRDDLVAATEEALAKLSAASTDRPVIGLASAGADAKPVAAAVAALAPRLGGSQRVVSSGTAAAVAESWIGAARGAGDVAYFAMADRTTAGLVRDGAPVTGSHGRAASVAWLSLNPVEREDYRRVGCLEAEVAASGVVRRLVWRIKTGDDSSVPDAVANDLAAITIEHVLEAARAGDGVSISVVRDTAKYLGMAAANLVVITDPEVLVLGGIIATAGDLLLDPLRAELARRLPRPMLDALAIVPAVLGVEAPAIGAARLVAPTLP